MLKALENEVEGNLVTPGFRGQPRRDFPDLGLAGASAKWVIFRRRRHETATALAGRDDAQILQVPVGASDRVGVDIQFLMQRSNCRQLIAFRQDASGHCRLNMVYDLFVCRDSGMKFEAPGVTTHMY